MKRVFLFYIVSFLLFSRIFAGSKIPLPEHPRPDFEREAWVNLNGEWQFEFDPLNKGLRENWFSGKIKFSEKINVPFTWGSKLSGLEDKADIGWYQRNINVYDDWKNKRIFITIGASDWETTVWLDGEMIGKHQGGYIPFSFELTDYIQYGKKQTLIIRVDDKRRDFTLYGKQGYGNARGIWQTVYLEARGKAYIDFVRFTPDIDRNEVNVFLKLSQKTDIELPVSIHIETDTETIVTPSKIRKGKDKFEMPIKIPKPRLWTLDDPFLYHVHIEMADDQLSSYFGMRKISVENLPGTDIPYIALNGKPVYLQLALDQSYHPDGYYTFPSDDFMKREIELVKSIGLNGIRPHIKCEIPRKLYWADKLGVLVMADLPNSWGEPDEKMQMEAEYTLRQMIKRDYNHPSIFSWILFNETWGLFTEQWIDEKPKRMYLPKTQQWVISMYYLAKSLDTTRLVEDNSICCGRGHTVTDINSFHTYLPGYEWNNYLNRVVSNTYEGSSFHFEDGYKQGKQPVINSECGNVWGYEGSTGDVDWSYDYHRMLNSFREHPQIAGWLYTEHHDVINEWNGYWRFDRSNKFTGIEEIFPGMTLNDFHTPVYLSTGNEICKTVRGGEIVSVPLFLSSMTDKDLGSRLTIEYSLDFINEIAEEKTYHFDAISVPYSKYVQTFFDPIEIKMPDQNGLSVLKLALKDSTGQVIHRNFMHFEIESSREMADYLIINQSPSQFSDQQWSQKQWQVLDGLKVNGAGEGFFEYTFDIPYAWEPNQEAFLLFELSAKQLFRKDMEENQKNMNVDYMRGGKMFPDDNPNSYPMTDETTFSSDIEILVNGKKVKQMYLPDDPADHRGVLSWHYQSKDRKLREAGSYGYLVKVDLSSNRMAQALNNGRKLSVQLKTKNDGGIAVYGKSFGRYPFDPSLVIKH